MSVSSKKTALDLRKAIKGQGVLFDFHVSVWRDPHKDGAWVVWVSPHFSRQQDFERLRAALTDLGHDFVCEGKPNTAGQYIIEVTSHDRL